MDKKTARRIWYFIKRDCGYFEHPFDWCFDRMIEEKDAKEFFDFMDDAIERMEETE